MPLDQLPRITFVHASHAPGYLHPTPPVNVSFLKNHPRPAVLNRRNKVFDANRLIQTCCKALPQNLFKGLLLYVYAFNSHMNQLVWEFSVRCSHPIRQRGMEPANASFQLPNLFLQVSVVFQRFFIHAAPLSCYTTYTNRLFGKESN